LYFAINTRNQFSILLLASIGFLVLVICTNYILLITIAATLDHLARAIIDFLFLDTNLELSCLLGDCTTVASFCGADFFV
jgi:hypothetical protein